MHPQLQFQPGPALFGVVVYALYRLLTSARWTAFLARVFSVPAATSQARERERLRAELAAFRAERLAAQKETVVCSSGKERLVAAEKDKFEDFVEDAPTQQAYIMEEPGMEPECEADMETMYQEEIVFETSNPSSCARSAPKGAVLYAVAALCFAALAVKVSPASLGRGLPALPPLLGGPPREHQLEDEFVFDAFSTNSKFGENEVVEQAHALLQPVLESYDYGELTTTKSSGGDPLVITLTRTKMEENDMEDFVRSAYSGTIMVGTPAEPFTVVFDTGSGHLMLPSTYCSSDTCKAHKRYRRTASSTGKDIDHDGSIVAEGASRDQIGVSFGTGEVTGVFVEDVVCVGGDADSAYGNLSAAEQGDMMEAMIANGELPKGCTMMRMIAATELSEDPFKQFEFDGILGLGLDGLSQTPEFNYINVISRAVGAWGGEATNTFAVFLANTVGEDSEIALGGWQENHLQEELSWGPVPDPELGHWLLDIKRIRIDDEVINFCNDGACKAAVDTGTSLLAVPTAVFPELFEMLKHPTPLRGHCDGTTGPQLHFEFEKFTVTLGPSEYAAAEKLEQRNRRPRWNKRQTMRTDLRCNPMLMTLDLPEPLGPKLFVLGEPVLRKYYTVYDASVKQIGFGRAKHTGGTAREHLIMDGALPAGRKTPTMFEIFRWRRDSRWRGSR